MIWPYPSQGYWHLAQWKAFGAAARWVSQMRKLQTRKLQEAKQGHGWGSMRWHEYTRLQSHSLENSWDFFVHSSMGFPLGFSGICGGRPFLGGLSSRTKDRFIDPPRLALCFAVLCGAGSVATESWHPVTGKTTGVSTGVLCLHKKPSAFWSTVTYSCHEFSD